MGTFTSPTDLYLGGILKVGTLAKNQYTRTHVRVRVAVRTREGAFLKSFWYREFRTLDITLYLSSKKALEALEL